MSQVNLLPAEILEGHRSRQIAALVGAAAALVLVLIFLFYIVQTQRLGDVNDDVATQQTANDNVQTQIGALQSYATLQARRRRSSSCCRRRTRARSPSRGC